jgi:thiol:disulfide interchange protein DsbA
MKKIVIVGLLLSLFCQAALAQVMPGRQYQEGVHYHKIEQLPAQRDTVEVAEVFSYMCSHCATFEPYIQSWKTRLPENVEFTRIPVLFGRRAWEMYARSYVAASLMGIEEEAHVAMMDAIWKERRQMRSMDELADFYAGFGVEKDAFIATANSFAVDARMRREQRDVAAFGITGTPSMIVRGIEGQYRISSGQQVPTFEAMLSVVDFLVAKELAVATAVAGSEGQPAPEGEVASN